MRNSIVLLVFLWLLLGCAPSELDSCFTPAGDTVMKEVVVDTFSQLRFENDVKLFIEQGPEYSVRLEGGERLLDEVSVNVTDDLLVIKYKNTCDLVGEVNSVTAYVTTPNLEKLRNSSIYAARSIGRLNFPNLILESNTSGGVEGGHKSGDFYLEVQSEDLRIEANGQSVFYIEGYTRRAAISFADELPRFEGPELVIDSLSLFHRSANQMIVRPNIYMKGRIVATGDVIALQRPATVEVTEEFSGRLIFR